MPRPAIAALALAFATAAHAQADLPLGRALDRADPLDWSVNLGAVFADGLRVVDDGGDRLHIDPRGFVALGAAVPEGVAAHPGDLAALGASTVVAPFWDDLDVTGCQPMGADNRVWLAIEADRLFVTWREVLPATCSASVEPMTFALQLGPQVDGRLTVEFHYQGLGSSHAFAPRAGLVVGDVIELFPDDGEEVPIDRAKALFDHGSEGVTGVWRFELAADGELVGDRDGDGVRDGFDNCWRHPNPLQANHDLEGELQAAAEVEGDVCDDDDDGDHAEDLLDNCPLIANPEQSDRDRDGLGDVCDEDRDGDGWPNGVDRCPDVHERVQSDLDRDGLGDRCDGDIDGDDAFAFGPDGRLLPDRCPGVFDADRIDTDRDGLGDRCDLQPFVRCFGAQCRAQSDWDGDGVGDTVDLCPWRYDHRKAIDTDGDGYGDACDGHPLRVDPPRFESAP